MEGTCLSRVGKMGSAAELCTEIAHFHNADSAAVFFSEQSGGTGLSGVLQRHDVGYNVRA